MTFKELLNKYNNSSKAQHGIFSMSDIVTNNKQYLEHINTTIDLSPDLFDTWYHSNSPIERFTNKVWFCNIRFILNSQVFCPRHETELIIEILESIDIPHGAHYIDLCSGTGAIGITILKKYPHLNGALLDISPHAIENIEQNLSIHRISAKVIQEDWKTHLTQHSNYQIITANFPYIGSNDPTEELTDPPLALYAEDDGWEHYGNILNWSTTNPNWKIILLEINPNHTKQWKEAKSTQEISIEIFNDLNGLARIVLITRLPNQ